MSISNSSPPQSAATSSNGLAALSFFVSIALGFAGGYAAFLFSIPMPWLIGALAANAAWVIFFPGRLNSPVRFPEWLRRLFIVVIAVMIGGSFTPELVSVLPQWWPSMLAVVIFTVTGQSIVYLFFHHVANLDRATAFFSASPGGLVESVMLGEEAGGDPRLIALMHFVRLTLIVAIVPFGFTLWTGETVGSAAGASFSTGSQVLSLNDVLLLSAAGIGGFLVARWIKLPAGAVVGPLIASGALHVSGITDGQVPAWLGVIAQVFMGTGIGVRFAGMKRAMMVRALGLCLVSVSLLLVLAMLTAIIVAPGSQIGPEIYLLGFAPAGIIEMSLIALTLGANPVFVTTHHIVRVLACVAFMPQIYHRVLARRAEPAS